MTVAPDISSLAPWLSVEFSRSSGPGGQNVNKVSTRVAVLFDFEQCPLLTADQRRRVRAALASRLSADGRVRVTSSRERSQSANRAAAEERLLELLRQALRPRTPRRPTKPTASSRARRLREKQHRAERKRQRTRPAD